jgi:large repetitive protein
MDAGSWAACGSPRQYTGLSVGSHTFSVRAADAAGNVDASPASRTWTVLAPPSDTTPPAVALLKPLNGAVVSGTLSEAAGNCEASASDAGGIDRVEFFVDGTLANTERSSPWACIVNTTSYPDGAHTIRAVAYDVAGNSSQAQVSVTFDNVPDADTTPPDTTISAGPSGTVSSTSASFGFSSEPGASFECRRDAGSWAACTSPTGYTGLAAGAHTFDVRARDAAGNVDPTPASRSWTIQTGDVTNPTVSITKPTAGAVLKGTLSEPARNCEAAVSDAGGVDRVEFFVDGTLVNTERTAPWACLVDTTAYPDGAHTLRAVAYDKAGNTAEASVSVSFDNVPDADTTPPDTTISSGPSGTVTSTSATFAFSSEPGAAFECRRDGGSWSACTSPKQYSSLSSGLHSFAVRAHDRAGNVDPTPATRSWTIKKPSRRALSGALLPENLPLLDGSDASLGRAGLRLRLRCEADGGCAGVVRLRVRGVKPRLLAPRTVELPGKGSRVVLIRLRRDVRRVLGRTRRLRVAITSPGAARGEPGLPVRLTR